MIREAADGDVTQWIGLRRQLWPHCSLEEHEFEVRSILSAANSVALLAVDDAGNVMGFIELFIRNYAEGCESMSVGYVEGIFVDPENRRQGVSKELFRAGERWALRQGCFEMGFFVSETKSGYWQGKELTRISVLPRVLNV